MKDLRSPLAKARDKWFEITQGKLTSKHFPGIIEEPFMKNRLELAFIAGWDACKKQKSKKARK